MNRSDYEHIEYSGASSINALLVPIKSSAPHYHSEYELLFVLDGTLSVFTGGEKRLMYAGDILAINPNEIHTLLCEDARNLCMVVQFRSELVSGALAEKDAVVDLILDSSRPGGEDASMRAIRRALANLGKAVAAKNEPVELLARATIDAVLYELFSRGRWQRRTDERDGSREFSRIIEFIRQHCVDGFSTEELCAYANMSRTTLYRFLRRASGATVKELTDRYRIERARELLRHTSYTIQDIAIMSGYRSCAAFYRMFKSIAGMQPGECRVAPSVGEVNGSIRNYGMTPVDHTAELIDRFVTGEKIYRRPTVNIKYEKNPNGPVLGYSETSGVKIIEKDGLKFKDLSRTGELLPYEDWRLTPEARARDLAGRLSLEQMSGLMLHKLAFGGADLASDDSVEQHFIHGFAIMGTPETVESACELSNALQQKTESMPFGIPAYLTSEGINASDDSVESVGGFHMMNSALFSKWPQPLGIASTFDPKYAEGWGAAASKEYRATGTTIALEPQIDVATEPRWNRFYQTFGEGSDLTTDMARAFIDGLQTSENGEIAGGWGYESVCATPKHFPGGATGEAGRDAHYNFGKYGVYPGNNFAEHLKPFRDGAFKLNGPTACAAYVMPYYTVSYNQDNVNGENVGNGFSSFILQNLLREKLGYKEGIFSDFTISPPPVNGSFATGRCWGIEEYSEEAKRLKGMLAGICVYGADDDYSAMSKAAKIAAERYGEAETKKLMEDRVYYILLNAFRQGLFENPYLEPAASAAVLPDAQALRDGYEAQLKSIIMLKNSGSTLPIRGRKTVYIPDRRRNARVGGVDLRFAVKSDDAKDAVCCPVPLDVVKEYYDVTDDPAKADFAMVFIDSPDSGYGWSKEDKASGGNGYLPISLQYRPYTAKDARAVSLAGGDIFESFTNRSYKDKSVATYNESDLDAVLETRRLMGDKPVIVSLLFSRPCVTGEFEPASDAILAHCGVQTRAIMDIVSGAAEPSGLLPAQFPKDMSTVEKQLEDVPFDMECHVDADGNVYDYGYGLNWSGKISDWRTEKYCKR